MSQLPETSPDAVEVGCAVALIAFVVVIAGAWFAKMLGLFGLTA